MVRIRGVARILFRRGGGTKPKYLSIKSQVPVEKPVALFLLFTE